MQPVVTRRLQEANVLEPGDDPAVFRARAVRPLNLVRIHGERDEDDDLPGQQMQPCCGAENGQAGKEQLVGALPPTQLGEISREVMVHDVWLYNGGADHWRVLIEIRVLNPVDGAGNKIGESDSEDEFGDEGARLK